MLFFLHIPKTAGTSLRTIVHRALGEKVAFVYALELSLRKPDQSFCNRVTETGALAVFGHFAYGAHDFFPGKAARYICFLRDPVARAASFYLHVARDANSRYHRFVKEGMSLRDLVKARLAPELNNNYVRVISDGGRALSPGPGSYSGPIDQLFARHHLDSALSNIQKHFVFVGITEQFRHHVRLLFSELRLGFAEADLDLSVCPKSS